MAIISVHKSPGTDRLRLVATAARIPLARAPRPDGTFAEPPVDVVYERDVPEAEPLLVRVEDMLASSRVPGEPHCYSCPAPLAVRAIELAVEALWPTRRLQCPDCQKHFVIPHAERRRMYLACPHCHNPLLNPAWDSA